MNSLLRTMFLSALTNQSRNRGHYTCMCIKPSSDHRPKLDVQDRDFNNLRNPGYVKCR